MTRRASTVSAVSEQLTFHVEFDDAGDGWTLARVREVPAIVTQGATIDEARDMVRSALRDWLEHYVASEASDEVDAGRRSEPLTVTIGSGDAATSSATPVPRARTSTTRAPRPWWRGPRRRDGHGAAPSRDQDRHRPRDLSPARRAGSARPAIAPARPRWRPVRPPR